MGGRVVTEPFHRLSEGLKKFPTTSLVQLMDTFIPLSKISTTVNSTGSELECLVEIMARQCSNLLKFSCQVVKVAEKGLT